MNRHYCSYEMLVGGEWVECGKPGISRPLFPPLDMWYCAEHEDYAGHPERNPNDPEFDPDWAEKEEEEY